MTHTEFKKRFLPLQPMLYREAMRVLCDKFEAEDAVQNLYIKLWELKDELNKLLSPEAYCRKILRNICIDRWRVMRASEENVEELQDNIADTSPPEIEVRETKECVEGFLKTLPQLQSRIMKMRMNGCGFEEIERITGVSQVNIRVIISRLRKRFRQYYNEFYK